MANKESNVKESTNETKVESMDNAMNKIKTLMAKSKETNDSQQEKKDTKQSEYNLFKSELAPQILTAEIISEAEDVKQNKKIAWLAYIIFFIPLLINRHSPFVRLHANEGLDVFFVDIFATICILCGKLIKFSQATAIIGHLLVILGIALFTLTLVTRIFQIVQVCKGRSNQTPWLWKTRFIK